MRILLAAKHAPHGKRPIGGVQSWCRTVADELNKRGHKAITWEPGQGVPLGGFDLGIIANVSDTSRALEWCQKSIIVCHGIIPAEKPLDRCQVIYTSEGVRDHWGGDGTIIRQPIDLDYWSPGQDNHKEYLIRFSYRGGLRFIENVATSLGLHYYHLRDATPQLARDVLRQAACVLATGRAALEAMACGVPVVLCDHRSAYQKPLLDLDTTGAMLRNYSGRGGITPTSGNVKQAVEHTVAAGSVREHVVKHHNVKDIVNQLLEVA